MNALIVCGSRNLVCDRHCVIVANAIERFIARYWQPDLVISGAQRGADTMGEHWAQAAGVRVERYPAQWELYGASAGPKRNAQMVRIADGLVVVRFPSSRGSADVLRKALAKGIPVVDEVIDV